MSSIDVSEKVKPKNGMNYLPWASAWAYIKEYFPNSSYRVIRDYNGNLYHNDGKTCWVETILYIDGKSQEEQLAIMDNRNKSVTVDEVQSTMVNKTIKRCLTKNAALFGLGLNLWYGEELSDEAKRSKAKKVSDLDVLKGKVVSICKELVSKGVDSKALYASIADMSGHQNPTKITDIETLKIVLERLEQWEV